LVPGNDPNLAIRLYVDGKNPGEEAILAKLLAADASWAAPPLTD
jgi:hypothetical protein